jgi:tRNA (guanine37-N1)-methyltransferase
VTLAVNVVTLFPEFFRGPLSLSIPGRAAAAGLVRYNLVQLRDFTHDRHQTVDDLPYGGGAGMVMKPEPFWEAVASLAPPGAERPAGPVVLMSARGKRFAHDDAVRLSLAGEVTFLCGHYKDVDQRVADHLATEELALGDFIVSGGEIPALAMVDAVVRLLPGAISDHESASSDSFYDGGLSAPSYTRPAEYRGHRVPEILLSGDHARIAAWRRDQAVALTARRRPELLEEPEH